MMEPGNSIKPKSSTKNIAGQYAILHILPQKSFYNHVFYGLLTEVSIP